MNSRNRIKCPDCAAIIESVHRHDVQYCKCGNVFVDGGRDYRRVGGTALDRIIVVNDDDSESKLFTAKLVTNPEKNV